ncbi:protein DEFECTIVE IN EXINE FORMATION 1-like isoform X1 [Stylophora pistillata]|uniref:protein DEFECTIVE IN EXINE FORMATION 1-like isoform X1 n=2 Tax=Stylophora pistillata TaxID=50429 RepID=UPI000C043930|nr:protein DEFECTIVE IN EXINE FORMATION 1-like isoform X1 [Stylophora pistillata]
MFSKYSEYSSNRVTGAEVIAHRAFFLSFIVTLTAHDCHRNLEPMWQSDVGSSPVVSSALVADVNGDNVKDVLATSLSGQVSVVDGRSGLNLAGWPVTLPGKILFAAPLLFDYDNDGMNELVLVTADGVVSFVKNDGSFLEGETFKVPPLVMKRDWFVVDPEQITNSDYISSVSNPAKSARLASISEFILDDLKDEQLYSNSSSDYGPGDSFWSKYHPGIRPSGLSTDGISVFVDPHIISTPLITDFNADGTEEELVIVANFYFEEKSQLALSGQGLSSEDLQNYLGSAIIVFNLHTKQLVFSSILHVSRKSSQYPAYALSSGSAVPVGGIVVGTSSGTVYFVKSSLNEPLFLSTMDSLPGQVIVSDVNQDGSLEILAIDNSGNIACKDFKGKMVWETTVSSSSAAGIRVADVDGDGFMEAVVATFDGYLWVLEGDTGKVLDGWPVKLPTEVRATVLLTKLVPGESTAADIIVPLIEGQIAIIRGSDRCTDLISVGKTVLGSAVSADIVPGRLGLEMVLGADDGTLLCIAHTPNTPTDSLALPVGRNQLFSWPAETLPCSGTTFYSGKVGVRFTTKSLENTQITGKYFPVEFEIRDEQPKDVKGKFYNLKIFIGRQLIFKKSYKSPGIYTEQVEVPSKPCRAVLVLKLITEHGQCFQNSLHLSFNDRFNDDMAWLLLVPFITTGCLLLILHGWTQVSADVLPTRMTGKKSSKY